MAQKKAGTLATGLHGRVQWHYHIAADVQGFIVERDARGQLFLRGAVTSCNDVRMMQSPLTFVVTVKGGEWQWPVEQIVSLKDHALVARLGAPLPRRANGGTGYV